MNGTTQLCFGPLNVPKHVGVISSCRPAVCSHSWMWLIDGTCASKTAWRVQTRLEFGFRVTDDRMIMVCFQMCQMCWEASCVLSVSSGLAGESSALFKQVISTPHLHVVVCSRAAGLYWKQVLSPFWPWVFKSGLKCYLFSDSLNACPLQYKSILYFSLDVKLLPETNLFETICLWMVLYKDRDWLIDWLIDEHCLCFFSWTGNPWAACEQSLVLAGVSWGPVSLSCYRLRKM